MNQHDYPAQDRAYLQAHKDAADMLQTGIIRAYHTTHDRQRGRLIYLETDQGWAPEPFYEEFPLEQWEQ